MVAGWLMKFPSIKFVVVCAAAAAAEAYTCMLHSKQNTKEIPFPFSFEEN